MISGLDLKQTISYSLKEDKDNPTVWELGVIPSYLFARISTEAKSNEIDTAFKLLQIAIKGWSNFNVEFRQEKQTMYGRELNVVPLDLIEQIPLVVVNQLSLKIMEINQITEIERKN